MATSRQFFTGLAIIVIVWYLGLSYLPQIVGTCLDGECSFSTAEIIVSLIIPLTFLTVPVGLEAVPYRKSLSKALSDIGLTRFNWTSVRLSAAFLLPLIVFYPLFALLTDTPLALRPNWQWFILSVMLNNGLAEETVMRGFVFRHLREGRTFWRGAALSTLLFAGYHLPLLLTAGAVIGIFAVVLALPTGFVTAYISERGNNTIWSAALLHVVYNGLSIVFVFPTAIQPIATFFYLVAGVVISVMMLVWAYRGQYGRGEVQSS